MTFEEGLLVIDDTRADADLLLGLLRMTGEEPSTMVVPKIEDALTLLSVRTVSLAILDLALPGMEGLEALNLLRHAHPDLPILVSSGHDELEEAAVEAGADEVLPKGELSALALRRAVRLCLARGRARAGKVFEDGVSAPAFDAGVAPEL